MFKIFEEFDPFNGPFLEDKDLAKKLESTVRLEQDDSICLEARQEEPGPLNSLLKRAYK